MQAKELTCCEHLPKTSPVRSPFSKIISMSFYDGTTSGIAQCSRCLRSYKYDLVAWDSGQDLRVYSLAVLPARSFDVLVKALSATTSPTWPVWFAPVPSDREAQTAIDNELARAAQPSCVVVSSHLEKQLLVGRVLTSAALASLRSGKQFPGAAEWEFWQTYVGLDLPKNSAR